MMDTKPKSDIPMKTQQHIDALYERRKTAGGFEQALIDAYMKADGGKCQAIRRGFQGFDGLT